MGGGGGEGFVRRGDGWVYWGVEVLNLGMGIVVGWILGSVVALLVFPGSFCCHAM